MGFWDTVGKVGKDVTTAVVEKSKEMNEAFAKLEGYSDEKLFDITKDTGFLSSSTSTEKKVAKLILKKRGHSV